MKRAGHFKAANPPATVWLQVGEIERDCEFSECSRDDVTWHDERIFDTDIEYRLVKRRSPMKGPKP